MGIKRILCLSAILLSGCVRDTVTLIEHTPPPAVVIPTTLPTDKMVISPDPSLAWMKPIVFKACESRFKRFIAIIGNESNIEDERWFGQTNGVDWPVEYMVETAIEQYQDYDIIVFVDNVNNKKLKRYPHVWYFSNKVWKEKFMNVTIWQAKGGND